MPPVTAEQEVGLSLSVERNGEEAVVLVGGELEFGTAAPLRTVLLDVAHDGADRLVVDLEAVEFIDSTGISLLVQAKQRLEAQGAQLVLRRPAHRVVRVLEIAGLRDLFDIE